MTLSQNQWTGEREREKGGEVEDLFPKINSEKNIIIVMTWQQT